MLRTLLYAGVCVCESVRLCAWLHGCVKNCTYTLYIYGYHVYIYLCVCVPEEFAGTLVQTVEVLNVTSDPVWQLVQLSAHCWPHQIKKKNLWPESPRHSCDLKTRHRETINVKATNQPEKTWFKLLLTDSENRDTKGRSQNRSAVFFCNRTKQIVPLSVTPSEFDYRDI